MREWVYFITRNSLNGVVSSHCDLWDHKPARLIGEDTITWTRNERGRHLGSFKEKALLSYGFMTSPDTDREVVRITLGVTEEMLKWKRK